MRIISGIIGVIVAGVLGGMVITGAFLQFESGRISVNDQDMKVKEKVELGSIKSIDGHRITLDNGNNILLRKPGVIASIFSPQDISLMEGNTVIFQKFETRNPYYLCYHSECHIMRDYNKGIEQRLSLIHI